MEHIFTVTEVQSGKRIDSVAAEVTKLSRSKLQKNGQFLQEVENEFKPLTGKTNVHMGETWKVVCAENVPLNENIIKWDFPLKVLAESKTWVAIEKPREVSVHPSASEGSQKTIVNALVHMFGDNLAANASRPGIVHRLDKVTSGVLLVAKTDKTLAYLQSHWSEVEKTYYAIVQGVPPRSGKIEGGIRRDPENRLRMTVSDDEVAKQATTLFVREKENTKLSLLRITIPTGRTHQIRAHLSSIGFSILGDTKYKGPEAERVFLHAAEISFPDPDTGKMMMVKSEMPESFDRL